MGCGCGKKTIRPGTAPTRTVANPTNATPVQRAQNYQSATTVRAPQGPVTQRRTV